MYSLDLIKDIILFLKDIESPEKEAEDILLFASSITKNILYRDNPIVTPLIIKKIESITKRRALHEPLQYIFGKIEFLGLTIKVGTGVLIPRPETELVTLEAINQIKNHCCNSVLDLCSGSGCIALSIAREFPNICVSATDNSDVTLNYAKDNADQNHIKNVTFIKSSLFDGIISKTFDLIISNPPYIKTSVINTLQPEIRLYEPIDALDGGEDGLYFYREILKHASKFLNPNGMIILEIGFDQGQDIRIIAKDSGFRHVEIKQDFANKDRIAIIHE